MSRIDEIRARLAAAAAGPWQWAYAYECRGRHWCLENEASAASGRTIDHHLVTLGTEEYECDDDGGRTRLDATPNFQLISNAPADLAYLLEEVARLRAALEQTAQMKSITGARKIVQGALADKQS